jgi:hypothetical protein
MIEAILALPKKVRTPIPIATRATKKIDDSRSAGELPGRKGIILINMNIAKEITTAIVILSTRSLTPVFP